LHPECRHGQAISGVFSVVWHSGLQYLPDVAAHEQSGWAHFSVFAGAIFFSPKLGSRADDPSPDFSLRRKVLLYRKEHIGGLAHLTPRALRHGRIGRRNVESGLEFGGFREAEVALGEGQTEEFLDFAVFTVAGHGEFADEEVAGALKHLLLAEGKRLGLVEGDQALEDSGNFEQRAGAHAVGILLEAVFPVGGAEVFGDGEKIENLLHLAVANHAANADAADVVAGDHDLETAGLDVEEIELFHRGADGAAADLFDDTHPVVGVDDLVADVEIQIRTTHKKAPGQE
jgi:hypothetical protein